MKFLKGVCARYVIIDFPCLLRFPFPRFGKTTAESQITPETFHKITPSSSRWHRSGTLTSADILSGIGWFGFRRIPFAPTILPLRSGCGPHDPFGSPSVRTRSNVTDRDDFSRPHGRLPSPGSPANAWESSKTSRRGLPCTLLGLLGRHPSRGFWRRHLRTGLCHLSLSPLGLANEPGEVNTTGRFALSMPVTPASYARGGRSPSPHRRTFPLIPPEAKKNATHHSADYPAYLPSIFFRGLPGLQDLCALTLAELSSSTPSRFSRLTFPPTHLRHSPSRLHSACHLINKRLHSLRRIARLLHCNGNGNLTVESITLSQCIHAPSTHINTAHFMQRILSAFITEGVFGPYLTTSNQKTINERRNPPPVHQKMRKTRRPRFTPTR